MTNDPRMACGARCTWWGSIAEVGSWKAPDGVRLPCCPICSGVLIEYPDEAAWWKRVDEHEADGHPGYRKIVEWMRGRCFKRFRDVQAEFERHMRRIHDSSL